MVKISLEGAGNIGDDLILFLEKKLNVKISITNNIVEISEGGAVPRTSLLKTYLKRFLYISKMNKDYKIRVNKDIIKFSPIQKTDDREN